MTAREMVLGLVTGTILLFGVSSIMINSRLGAWKDLLAKQDAAATEIAKLKYLYDDKGRWDEEYESMKSKVNVFPADQRVDVHFMTLMDSAAAKNNVTISKRQPGEEKKEGDMFELPIECTDVEGSQEDITRFLFDLEGTGAMMDVRQLWLKPKGGGVLRGRFTLYCAYMREQKSREKGNETKPVRRKNERAGGA